MTATTMRFCCYPSRIPTSALGQRDVGATGRIPKRSSTTAAPSVASVMSSTSGRVASAPRGVYHRQDEHRDVGTSINEHYLS
jgi:hypothetical protein